MVILNLFDINVFKANKAMANKGFRHSRLLCCVVDCPNTYANTSETVKFYSFPNKPYEVERRKVWIQRVKRISEDGKSWTPTKNDRICSAHFVGNAKSTIESHPAYHPSIFPEKYKARVATTNAIARYERSAKRRSKLSRVAPTKNFTHKDHLFHKVQVEEETNKRDFSNCQVKKTYHITCESTIIENEFGKEFYDKCVGNNDDIKCISVHGYSSITSVCGVSLEIFQLLLSLLSDVHFNVKMCLKKQLMIFLMKFKLGLTYQAIGIFFGIHPTTISDIFLKRLYELAQKTANKFVYWPERQVIDATMPEVFKVHYPRTRVIIDCSEILIQHPNTVGKFLIGIAPNGFISFVSKVYDGKSSDTFITNDCGILEKLESEDLVLADKGFRGIKLPSSVHGVQLTVDEVEASVRIHVERIIQMIKIYEILEKISHDLFPHIDNIISMCCVLSNLQTTHGQGMNCQFRDL